jgi:hypothetical protein
LPSSTAAKIPAESKLGHRSSFAVKIPLISAKRFPHNTCGVPQFENSVPDVS